MRDLRQYARQTTARLVIGSFLILLTVGTGLIYWRYGQGAAGMALLCLLGALIPITLIVIVLWIIDWVVKRARSE